MAVDLSQKEEYELVELNIDFLYGRAFVLEAINSFDYNEYLFLYVNS